MQPPFYTRVTLDSEVTYVEVAATVEGLQLAVARSLLRFPEARSITVEGSDELLRGLRAELLLVDDLEAA
jgi:hypothetical protein